MTLDTTFAAGTLDLELVTGLDAELLVGLDAELLVGLDAGLVADAAIVLVTGASVDFATTDGATTAADGMVFTVGVDFNVVVMLDAGLMADATTGTAAEGAAFAGADATRDGVTRGAAGRAATVSAGFPAGAGGGGVVCANISVSSPSFARSCATRVAYEPWRRTRLNWER
jgi:hypothetical protein